jgi:hypothetical protein
MILEICLAPTRWLVRLATVLALVGVAAFAAVTAAGAPSSSRQHALVVYEYRDPSGGPDCLVRGETNGDGGYVIEVEYNCHYGTT